MTKVYIHIGPHKTGTSALQAFLYLNRRRLKERGVVYKTLGNTWNNHHPLVVQFRKSLTDRSLGKRFIRKLLKEAESDTIIISSEMLCEPDFDVEDLLKCFEGHDVTTIAYLRHPCDLIVSAFNEIVRSSQIRRTRTINQSPLPYDPSLKSIVGFWLQETDIVFCPYDKAQWKDGNLAADFLSVLGLSMDGFENPDRAVNSSLNFSLLEVVRVLNSTGVDESTRAEVIEILKKAEVPPNNYPLNAEFCKICFDSFKEAMPLYEPHFREGFQTEYLFESRNRKPAYEA